MTAAIWIVFAALAGLAIGHGFGWKWALQVVIALDQLLNALLAGNADETLSARAHRMSETVKEPKRRWLIMRILIDAAFFWESDHCYNAWQAEVTRQHMRGDY